jgi:hypothetical protein
MDRCECDVISMCPITVASYALYQENNEIAGRLTFAFCSEHFLVHFVS